MDVIPGHDTDEVLSHLSSHMSEHNVTVRQLHAELSVRQRFDNISFNVNRLFFGHTAWSSFVDSSRIQILECRTTGILRETKYSDDDL